jgi:hypothetical protein
MENTWILPEVKEQIEDLKRHQKIKEQIKIEEKLFEKDFSSRYVLIDAALWDRDIDDIFLVNVIYHSLFRGSTGEQLWSVAPYLVGSNEDFIKLIKKKDPIKRRVTWIHSALSVHDLRKHLRRFLRMKTESGTYIYFRFYDPYIVNTVFPNLTKEQVNEFFDKIEYIITEDARINERRIYSLSVDKELRIKYETINHVDNK